MAALLLFLIVSLVIAVWAGIYILHLEDIITDLKIKVYTLEDDVRMYKKQASEEALKKRASIEQIQTGLNALQGR